MPAQAPNFSAFPYDRLPRRTRREAAIESALARWSAAGQLGERLAALLGGPVRARLLGATRLPPDPHAAIADLRVAGASIALLGSARGVRAIAQRLLGGPVELDAPRPLTVVEQAIWALVVAAAIADLGMAAEVWPLEGRCAPGAPGGAAMIAWTVALPGALGTMTVTACVPADLLLRAPPPRPLPAWEFDVPVIVGRCGLARAGVAGLAVRDVITIEACLELGLRGGGIGLAAEPGAVEARGTTGYVGRDMALADEAWLEVTVQLGATRLSLRQIGDLSIGQIVPLGRPLAGPYEIRAAGRLVGQGELVDIDGELGVRIVSIAD